ARNRFAVIAVRGCADAGETPAVNRRNLVYLWAAAAPFAIEHAGVLLCKPQFFERSFHGCIDRSAVIWGAHAARVLVSAARRNEFREKLRRRKEVIRKQVREHGPPSPAPEPRALPRPAHPRPPIPSHSPFLSM